MKRIFSKKSIFFCLTILLTFAFLFLFSGCSSNQQISNDTKQMTVELLDSLVAGDKNASYSIAQNACSPKEFDSFYQTVAPIFEKTSSYELRRLVGILKQITEIPIFSLPMK